MKSEGSENGCSAGNCCRVEAVVTVDERGQMVLPKEIRAKAGIRPGDKLALIGWEENGSICCLSLISAESLGGLVRDMLGPMMSKIDSARSGTGTARVE